MAKVNSTRSTRALKQNDSIKSAAPKRKSKLTNRSADKIFADFEAQPAIMTMAQLDEFEAIECSNEIVIRPRRAALFSLTLSGKKLSQTAQKSREDAKSVAVMMLASDIYLERLRMMAELMEKAKVRCQIALCNCEDIEALIDEVAAEMTTEGEAA